MNDLFKKTLRKIDYIASRTFVASREAEGEQRTDDAEHVVTAEDLDFASRRVAEQQLQRRAPTHTDLLQSNKTLIGGSSTDLANTPLGLY